MKKALLLLGMAWFFASSFAQSPGDLDPTFNGSGYVTAYSANPGESVSFTNVEAMSDGRIVAAGRFSPTIVGPYLIIARYLDNGDLDTSFAHTGRVELTDHEVASDEIGMDLQADGKVLVAGAISDQGIVRNAIYRLNVDGSLDSTFGVNGLVLDSLTAESHHFYSVFAEPSGRILATSSGDLGISVTAFEPNGQRDLTYGSGDGTVYVPFASSPQGFLIGSFLQTDGKMLTLTYADSVTRYLVRIDAQGQPDSTLDNDGVQMLTYQSLSASPDDVTADSAGNIFLAAYFDLGNYEVVAVFKFTPSGVRDSTFGNNGMARIGEPNTDCYPYGIKIAPDGRILLSGEVYTNVGAQGIFVGRLMPNGRADSSFSNTGMSTPYVVGSYHSVASMAIQPDGKILAAGIYVDLTGEWAGTICRFIYGTPLTSVSLPSPLRETTVFPNPSIGLVKLHLQAEFESTLDVSVVDLTGRIVAQPIMDHSLDVGMSEFQLDLQNLPAGAYLLQAKTGESVQTHRIIIAH